VHGLWHDKKDSIIVASRGRTGQLGNINVLEALVNVITGADPAQRVSYHCAELNRVEVKCDADIVERDWTLERMESRKEYGLAATRMRLVRR
jgi:hypothetical protein